MHRSAHRNVARKQAQQLGLFTAEQGNDAGLTKRTRKVLLDAGLIERVRRGVYASSAVRPTYEQAVLSAALAIGEHAFASHETAAWLWQLPTPGDEPPPIELTTLLERRARVPGVRVHRSGKLLDQDTMTRDLVRLTSPERTIFDLSSRFTTEQLGAMADDALRRRLTTTYRLAALLTRLGPAPGRSPSKVRLMLDRRVPGVEDRESILEDFVFDALRRYGLPLPVPQHWVRLQGTRRRIDLCYTEQHIAIEALGFDVRRMRTKFDDEALRGNELQLAGYQLLQFTSGFTDRMIAEQVAAALGLEPTSDNAPALTFEEWKRRR